MAEVTQPGPVPENACIREAVCIHTQKILDSCLDKDCIEDLRVYLTRDSQNCLERATSVKARSAELLYVYIDVESVPFNCGFFTVDLTFYYKVLADVMVGTLRPTTVYGLAIFSKRVMLYGGEGSAKIFTSRVNADGPDQQLMAQSNKPMAVVEVVDPVLLDAKVVETDNNCCDCCSEVPESIGQCFDDELVTSGDGRRLLVTLGQFSIIRLERDTQLLMPVYDYCIPTKDCSASGISGEEEDPCALFGRMDFPVSEFFPTGCGNGNAGGGPGGSGGGNCSCRSCNN